MHGPVKPKFRLLYNHDGYCVFQQSSPYQKIEDPVGLAQVHGYVDEAAASGCDALMLSPVISSMPIWPSKVEVPPDVQPVPEETVMDVIYNRMTVFKKAGHDFVRLTADRAHEKGLAFFISWRMNEMHDLRRGHRSPIQSRFWRDHPEYRLSGPKSRTLWGRALDFSHEAVRDYKFALIRELCTRYPIDGLELDFNRFARFFPGTMSHEERVGILNGFVERVRRMLDTEAKGVPLCARVPNRLDLVEEMGLDLPKLVKDGVVQMVNVAPFIVTQPDADIEGFRAAIPDVALYGEITHCTHYGRLIETGLFEERPITQEILLSTAHSFLERGCDGLSAFNFGGTRGFALSSALDRDCLRRSRKHYLLTDDRYSRQLPVRLNVEDEKRFRFHIADNPGEGFVHSSLSVCTDVTSPPAEFEVLMDENPLESGKNNGDFLVPLERLKKGWNEFAVRLVSTPRVTIERLELTLNR